MLHRGLSTISTQSELSQAKAHMTVLRLMSAVEASFAVCLKADIADDHAGGRGCANSRHSASSIKMAALEEKWVVPSQSCIVQKFSGTPMNG